MDPVDTRDQEIQREQTSRNRICIVIAVMACIISGSFILLGVSLKRNNVLVGILQQYQDQIKQQLPPNVINGAVLSAASSNNLIVPKQPEHLKHAIRQANRTRQEGAQLVYLSAPEARNFTSRKKLHRNSSSPITRHQGEYAPDVSDSLAGARNIQQQIQRGSASLLRNTTTRPALVVSVGPSISSYIIKNEQVSNTVRAANVTNVTSLLSSGDSVSDTPTHHNAFNEARPRSGTASRNQRNESETTIYVGLTGTTLSTSDMSLKYQVLDDDGPSDSGDSLDAVVVTASARNVSVAQMGASSLSSMRDVSGLPIILSNMTAY